MTRSAGTPSQVPRSGWSWVATGYTVGVLAFFGGLAGLLGGRSVAGVALATAGILVVTIAYLAPLLPWENWRKRWSASSSPRMRGGAPTEFRFWSLLHPRAVRALGVKVVDGVVSFLPESGVVNRLFLLLPAVLLLAFSAVLSTTSTVQGVIAFSAAVLVLWVYFQDMQGPLVLPHTRHNARAVLAQAPALPGYLCGIWLLGWHYDSPAMVWTGFAVGACSSAWTCFALRRWTLVFTIDGAMEAPLTFAVSRPFFGLPRVSFITGLAAGSAVAAILAEFVFPGDHAGLSVAMGFLAMLLLVGSFPWFPRGLAFHDAVPPVLGALLASASAALAFVLGAHGQDLIEQGSSSAGLWFFLAGGGVLVLGLSRFGSVPGNRDASDDEFWRRLEIAAVILLGVLAFGFRVWKIGSFPFGVEGDEGGGGVWALDILRNNVENHFINQNYPLAFFSVTAVFFKLWGVGLATLRMHAVVFGTLSIFTTYFFLRANMDRAAAFLAVLLMSFSYWHLHFSRFGHYNIEQVAIQMAAFYFVFKGFRTARLWCWGVGGLAFGLAMFPHMAGRILPFEGIALVLYLLLDRRDLLRRHAPGFLFFLAMAWAVASPAVVYWVRAQGRSMGRIQEVSIFDKNNTNAPTDTLAGFVHNCRTSMMMFNDQGDTRSRDNPVAPDKVLEHWTAVLFGLALLYVLYHWREPVNFFLLAVFFMNLCASIFSVEAPQALRTAGNIPIVFAFMAVPLADLMAGLGRAGRWQPRLAFFGLLAAFSFFSWRSARRLFVDERNLAFDTAATYIAQTAGLKGGPDTQAVFWGTGFASSHPPMQLLRGNTPLRNFYGPFEYLPITLATGHDHLLFFADDYQQIVPYVEWIYPKVHVRSIPDQQGNPLALYVRVDKDAIGRSEGLDGWAWVAGKEIQLTSADPAVPVPGLLGVRSLKLRGALSVDEFGTYRLSVSGRGDAEVIVDGKPAFTRRQSSVESPDLLLAKGLHNLDVVLRPASTNDGMALSLRAVKQGPPNAPWSLQQMGGGVVDRAHLLRFRANGFFSEYFESRVPQGTPVLEVIEPVVLDHWLDPPLLGNWSARWSARFRVTVPGEYRFSVGGGTFSEVKVDSTVVWRVGQNPRDDERPAPVRPFIRLSPGWHDYEAWFSTVGGPDYDLDWTTPAGKTGVFWTPGMQPLP